MSKKADISTIPHRGIELLDVLARHGGTARNAQIAKVMGVSEETVRRLVKALEKDGKVERVHGGTYLIGQDSGLRYSTSLSTNSKAKTRIAAAATDIVPDGSAVFLNVGSTTTFVAEQLRLRRELVVVSNSLSVVQALAGHNGNRVFLAGGEVDEADRGAFGSHAEEFIANFAFDFAICGADAIDADNGFLLRNPLEAQMSRRAVSRAKEAVIVADATKFGMSAPHVCCVPDAISWLVTDAAPDPKLAGALKSWSVKVQVAK